MSGRLPPGNTRSESLTAGNIPAENRTPGSLRNRVPEYAASALRFEADFEGDEDFSIAGKQSMYRLRILKEVLITRLVTSWIQGEN